MTTFIFQGNPDRFDIDGYLGTAPERISWLVTSSRKEIELGDQVFIWRAKGRGEHGSSGIIAECLVESPVSKIPEDPSAVRFWREPLDTKPRNRVWLTVIRATEGGTILDRDTIKKVPGLEAIGPIGFGNATNFKLSEREGRDISRLWRGITRVRSAEQVRKEFEAKAAALEELSLEQLIDRYQQSRGTAGTVPSRTFVSATLFDRNPYVKAIARVRAGFRCELPGCPSPSFQSVSEQPYSEIHHLLPLAKGGKDTIENVVCLCANHHRELHFGRRRDELSALLRSIPR